MAAISGTVHGQGQSRDGGPAQVVEVQVFVAEFGALERLVP